MIKLSGIDLELGGRQIFENFSFFAGKGEKVLLNAPSGAGKSCLLKIIMGFMRPSSGSVVIGGDKLSGNTVARTRKRICYIGQDASLPDGKVADLLSDISSFKANRGADFSSKNVSGLVSRFSLEDETLQKNVEALSGGERQRLSFVICLLLNRDIWLLDEITAGLDEERKTVVMENVMKSGKTVIVASHDPGWKEYGIRVDTWREAR
jgi:putative ABC transport system ATP-binding protein